jgi:hypothetical protein
MVSDTSPVVARRRRNARRLDGSTGDRDVDDRRRRRLSRGDLLDTSKAAGYVFKVAQGREEVEGALRVVYTCYRQFGLVDVAPTGVRVTCHHLLPDTRILIAKKDHDIHSTLTMVPDSAFGLPMEHEFEDSLRPLREQRAQLAEITSLATLAEYRSLSLFMYLYRLLLLIGRRKGLTDFVLVVNPKHVRFYRDILLFEQIGPERSYGAVGGAPGIPFRMNIERTLAEGQRIYTEGGLEQDLYGFFSGPWRGGEASLEPGTPADDGTLAFLLRAVSGASNAEQIRSLVQLYRQAGAGIALEAALGKSNDIGRHGRGQ